MTVMMTVPLLRSDITSCSRITTVTRKRGGGLALSLPGPGAASDLSGLLRMIVTALKLLSDGVCGYFL